MACGQITFLLVAVLASLAYISGEEGSGHGHGHGTPHDDHADRIIPDEKMTVQSPFGSFSLPFDQLLAAFSQFMPNNSNSSSGGFGGFGSFPQFMPFQVSRDAEVEHNDHHGHHGEHRDHRQHGNDGEHGDHDPESRLFFSSFAYSRTCNYTTRPGRTCLTCRQQQTCLPNNVGIVRRCGFLKPYCFNGRCSKISGPLCDATTATTAAATTTT